MFAIFKNIFRLISSTSQIEIIPDSWRIIHFKCQKLSWRETIKHNSIHLWEEVCIISAPTSLICCTWSAQLHSCLGYYSAVQTTALLFSQKTISFLQLLFNSHLHCNASSFSLVLHFSQSLIFLPLTGQPLAPAKSCPRNFPEMSQTGHVAMGSWWPR